MNVLDGNGPLETIKGVFYRENGKICYNGPQLRVENLDDLGFPAYELVDMNTYKKVGIIWHRGCPYNCAFCDVSQMWGRKVTSRSIDCVIEEIEMLSTTYKIKSIQFFDDTFTLRKDHTVEMCKNLKKLDVSWAANGRVNMVSKNLLKTMEDAGCRGVLYGIESGSNRVLKEINKKFTVEDVIDVIGKTPESILVKVSFIWNYPFETLADFYKTFLFISYLLSNRIHARYSPLSLFAQSQLYRQYKDNLIIDREKSIHWNTLLSQNLVNEGGLTLPSWVRDLVFENPDIFPGLLWVKSPNMEEKIQFVRKYMQIMGQL
jgi:radical SAM superfamily enzyme YgiQ (UPF0313 family)